MDRTWYPIMFLGLFYGSGFESQFLYNFNPIFIEELYLLRTFKFCPYIIWKTKLFVTAVWPTLIKSTCKYRVNFPKLQIPIVISHVSHLNPVPILCIMPLSIRTLHHPLKWRRRKFDKKFGLGTVNNKSENRFNQYCNHS